MSSKRNPFPFPQLQNDDDFVGSRSEQKSPFKMLTSESQQLDPWNRLNRTPTLSSSRREIYYADPRAPHDSLDFVIKAEYDHHNEFLHGNNETLIQKETTSEDHGRILKNRIKEVPPPFDPLFPPLKRTGFQKKESVYCVEGAIQSHHSAGTNRGYSQMQRYNNPLLNLDEEGEEEEENVRVRAEEARIHAAQLQKELDEQNKFDCLCDGVNSAMSLMTSAFNELLELKDELLTHGLPPSLLVALTLTTGKMYRSITDLHTPVRELTRLVSIYSVPWEQKSESLKKLHNDYESKQRQLNIAIRKLQLIDTATRRMQRAKVIMNWEKVFAKVSSAKTHGRRWKFMIEAFKKKVKDGINLNDLDIDEDDEDDDESDDEEDQLEQDEGVSEKQRFMMSVITASPPPEEDGGSQAQGSDLGSDADGIPSEMTESSGNAEEMTPDLPVKPKRRGVSFGVVDEVEEQIVIKPELVDTAVWTNEPEFSTYFAMRVFRPMEIKDDNNEDLSCSLSFGGTNVKTGVLPLQSGQPGKVVEETLSDVEGEKISDKAARRKSIGFASRPSSPPAPSTPTKKLGTKPSSILKKGKVTIIDEVEDSDMKEKMTEIPIIDRNAFEEILLPLPDEIIDDIKIGIFQGEKKMMIGMGFISSSLLDEEKHPVKFEFSSSDGSENEVIQNINRKETEAEKGSQKSDNITEREQPDDFEDTLASIEPMFVPLQGIKIGIGGHGSSQIGRIPFICYHVKKEIKTSITTGTNTDSIKDLVKEVTGVDMDQISKEDLIQMLGREYNDVCTSAMSFASSSSHKSGFIPAGEMEAIREQHDREVQNIQAEYEAKLQQLLSELERMQHMQMMKPANGQDMVAQLLDQEHDLVDIGQGNIEAQQAELRILTKAERESMRVAPPVRRSQQPVLPDWGAHLPKNVWVRMRMLTEEMMEKRRQLDARIRKQIAVNIEKKLSSQYKLQRADNTIRGPLQDVSLPAVFMPSRTGSVYNPRAHMYFHPTGMAGDLRLSQPPSIFQLPPLPEKARLSVVNLFELSKNFRNPAASDWLTRIASAPLSKGSRATTAASRMSRFATPTTPAPTANVHASDA